MVLGDKAAVIYSGGVISGAVASAFARAGRVGGADSRGCRGTWPVLPASAAGPPRLAGGRPPWPGESSGSLTRTRRRTAPSRELSQRSHAPAFWCAYRPVRDPVEAVTPTVELPTIGGNVRVLPALLHHSACSCRPT